MYNHAQNALITHRRTSSSISIYCCATYVKIFWRFKRAFADIEARRI